MAQQVLVIDDHPNIAELLAIHLTSGFEIDEAANSAQMQIRLKTKQYDIAVLDLELKDGHSGLEHIQQLHDNGIKVLIYSGALDADLIKSCFIQKVAGIMDKNTQIREVAKAIFSISEGHRVIPDEIMLAIATKDQIMPRLTHNEVVVLNFHFQVPMPTKASIASDMGLTAGRISNITASLFNKLEVDNCQAMVVAARKRGHNPKLPLPKKDPRQK
ncbi:MAG: Response regulator protein VraR [Pseudomonadota bacterium]|jgi:DNA-binding NarL/FixJ family response regulator